MKAKEIETPNLLQEFEYLCNKYDRCYFMHKGSLKIIGDGRVFSKFAIINHDNKNHLFTEDYNLSVNSESIENWINNGLDYVAKDLINSMKNNRVDVEIIVKTKEE